MHGVRAKMAAREPSARSEASARSSPSGHRLLMDYFAQVSKYLVVEVSICVCVSMLCKNVGPPPWRLKADSWHDTVSRVSLWLSVCHGTASLANGAFSKDFQTIKWKIAWLTCFLLSCTSQAVAVAVPAVPPLARLVVAGVANAALIMVHVLPQVPEGWDTAFLCFRFQVEDRALWVSHALLLIETTNQVEEAVPLRRLAVIVLAQAIWQIIAWVDALQSAPYHRYALVTTAMQLSHIVSIHMTWQAQALGVGHAAIVVYLFFAASSALYEPRVNLPNFAANKTMDVWSRIIHPSLNPVYTSTPLLAALFYMAQAAQSAAAGAQPGSVAVFGAHLCISQMVLLALRCVRFHYETKERQIVEPPAGLELWVDAVVLGVFKMLLISGFQDPR